MTETLVTTLKDEATELYRRKKYALAIEKLSLAIGLHCALPQHTNNTD